MDLARVPNERKLYLCRWYFRGNNLRNKSVDCCFSLRLSGVRVYDHFLMKNFQQIQHYDDWLPVESFSSGNVGFLLLSMVWAVNALWFFNEAFRKPQYEEQGPIKKYVIFSTIGAVMWIVPFIGWITIFLQNRVAWGEFADDISILIPTGSS